MSKPPASVALWMPWFIKEHRANASTLSHIEHSALCYLLMLFWEHEGQLPNDDKYLAKHLKLSARQWGEMRDTLLHECTIAGGIITHPALTKEVEKARKNQEQKSIAGKASAAARKANGCSTAVATAVQPRAGSGEGDGPIHGMSSVGESVSAREDSNPFRVIGGGK